MRQFPEQAHLCSEFTDLVATAGDEEERSGWSHAGTGVSGVRDLGVKGETRAGYLSARIPEALGLEFIGRVQR